LLNEVKSKISASLLRELITSFREAKKGWSVGGG
jgi:hypothetical protein